MPGIYIHIPFCKTRCIYCDFFSSADMTCRGEYIRDLCRELHDRRDYLGESAVDTLYFGGGTPSQLTAGEFDRIFEALSESVWAEDMEITLEANPDDISNAYLDSLRHLPFNRISLGVQSFDDKDLQFLNRRHDAQAARRAVQLCREYDFRNISLDLMYGLPGQTIGGWKHNIRQAFELGIEHLSAYHLIYEEGTPLHRLVDQGQVSPVDEELSVALFETLIDESHAAGYEHYEISNFARPGFRSRHNSAYWDGSHYLGVGAGAHSYNGISRQWNAAVSQHYLEKNPEIEFLDEIDRYNDYILTRMRTKNGICSQEIGSQFGKRLQEYSLAQAKHHLGLGNLQAAGSRIRLSRKGIFISDSIMSDFIASRPK